MVLGTPHLSQLNNFKTTQLHRLLDSLNVIRFDVVAIENMPPQLLFDIKSRQEKYWQELYSSFNQYIEFGTKYQKEIGLSYDAAFKKVGELNQKQNISDNERLEYVNSFICMYDICSATLHYKQLVNKTKLPESARNLLDKLSESGNEINTVGIQIAIANKLRQLYYIDNLQDETILLNQFVGFMEDYSSKTAFINEYVSKTGLFETVSAIENEAIKNNDLYPLYKFYNSSEYSGKDFETQWALWFKTNFTSKTDRVRYALWEMRNLSIAANILHVVAMNPEKKILVIIGASHKSFLEKYLKQIPEIELINL